MTATWGDRERIAYVDDLLRRATGIKDDNAPIERLARSALRTIRSLEKQNKVYRKALKQIEEGKGPYKMDRLAFAESVIEDMKRIASEALAFVEKKG